MYQRHEAQEVRERQFGTDVFRATEASLERRYFETRRSVF
jgi:hypothetical protein